LCQLTFIKKWEAVHNVCLPHYKVYWLQFPQVYVPADKLRCFQTPSNLSHYEHILVAAKEGDIYYVA